MTEGSFIYNVQPLARVLRVHANRKQIRFLFLVNIIMVAEATSEIVAEVCRVHQLDATDVDVSMHRGNVCIRERHSHVSVVVVGDYGDSKDKYRTLLRGLHAQCSILANEMSQWTLDMWTGSLRNHFEETVYMIQILCVDHDRGAETLHTAMRAFCEFVDPIDENMDLYFQSYFYIGYNTVIPNIIGTFLNLCAGNKDIYCMNFFLDVWDTCSFEPGILRKIYEIHCFSTCAYSLMELITELLARGIEKGENDQHLCEIVAASHYYNPIFILRWLQRRLTSLQFAQAVGIWFRSKCYRRNDLLEFIDEVFLKLLDFNKALHDATTVSDADLQIIDSYFSNVSLEEIAVGCICEKIIAELERCHIIETVFEPKIISDGVVVHVISDEALLYDDVKPSRPKLVTEYILRNPAFIEAVVKAFVANDRPYYTNVELTLQNRNKKFCLPLARTWHAIEYIHSFVIPRMELELADKRAIILLLANDWRFKLPLNIVKLILMDYAGFQFGNALLTTHASAMLRLSRYQLLTDSHKEKALRMFSRNFT